MSPRPDLDIVNQANWATYNYHEDAEDDWGRRDQPEDFAPRLVLASIFDSGGIVWGWDFIEWDDMSDESCTGIFDTSDESIDLVMYPWSIWSGTTGNQIVVLDCLSGDCELRQTTAQLTVETEVQDILYTGNPGVDGDRFAMHWAMSFSEWRRAYHTNKHFYGALWSLTEDYPIAISNTLVGGRPTQNHKNVLDADQTKRTYSHEYGHLQTLPLTDPFLYYDLSLLDYCYPQHCTGTDADTNTGHSFQSQEWQAAAAAEGFAHFYALSVWNNVGESFGSHPHLPNPNSVPFGHDVDGYIDATRTDDLDEEGQSIPHSYYEANYSGAGSAVGRDWAFFLWDLVNGANPLDIDDVMLWLIGYWDDATPWPAADGNSDWWDGFESYAKQNPMMSMAEQTKFDNAAADNGGRDVDQ